MEENNGDVVQNEMFMKGAPGFRERRDACILHCSREAPERKQEVAAWVLKGSHFSTKVSSTFTTRHCAAEETKASRGAVIGPMAHSCGGTALKTLVQGLRRSGSLGP